MTMNKFETKIENYITQLGYLNFEKPEPGRWYVKIEVNTGEIEFFVVEILLMDKWVSFSSVVITNLQGKNLSKFYEILLRLTNYLHAFKFGVSNNGEVITLQTEWNSLELDLNTFQGIIKNFQTFYHRWYPQIIDYATKLGLRYRKSLAKFEEIDQFVKKLVAMKDYKTLGSRKKKSPKKFGPSTK